MDKSFLNMAMDESMDSEASFLNLSGSPRRRGANFSFYEDSSLFSGDQSPPPLFKTPLPPAETSGYKKPMKETEKQQKMFSNNPCLVTPPAPERKDPNQKESHTMKQLMENQMKEILESVEALETHQEKGGAQLLAKSAAVRQEVSDYKEELNEIKKEYLARLDLAFSTFRSTK